MLYPTPTVGMSGALVVSAPFTSQITAQAVYTCTGIESLSGMIASDQDPFTDLYQPAGLTEDQMNQDAEDNVLVITVQAFDGDLVRIPNKYLLGLPDPSGVPYQLTMLGLALDAMPTGVDLTALVSDVQDLILSRVGVHSTPQVMVYGAVTLLTQADHEVLQASRVVAMADQSSYLSQLQAVTRQLQALQSKYSAMESYIKAHLPAP